MITKTKENNQSLYTREQVLDSWDEWIQECQRRADWVLERNHGAKESSIHQESRFREEFSGTRTFGESVSLAQHGWPEGLGLMMKMREDLGVVYGSLVKRARTRMDWTGGTVSVARWLGNKPKPFRRRVQQFELGTGRVISLTVDISASAYVPKENMMRRGASILLLIDALETAGISCQVEIRERVAGRYEGASYCIQVPIKQAGEHLDMDLMAFALVHPSVLRRLCFAMLGGEDDDFFVGHGYGQNNREGGYGRPILSNENKYLEETDIEIPDNNTSEPWGDINLCATWVRDKMKNCGVKSEHEVPA